jgi:hypothetical protein
MERMRRLEKECQKTPMVLGYQLPLSIPSATNVLEATSMLMQTDDSYRRFPAKRIRAAEDHSH